MGMGLALRSRVLPNRVAGAVADPGALRALDLDTTIEVHLPYAEGVVPEGLGGQRPQMRTLLLEHGRKLVTGNVSSNS